MRIDILTLFPEMIEGVINSSIIKRAITNNLLEINVIDYRNYSQNKNKKVDDYTYGGGAGMLISPVSIVSCLQDIPGYKEAHKIVTSAQGKPFKQRKAKELSAKDHLIIICGHYEGIDERVLNYIDEEISIGDYILTGGELAAMVIADAVIRLIPEVLGNEESAQTESFDDCFLEYPQYTRPEVFEEKKVPEVLLSGNHEKIRKWRRYMAIKKTYLVRPELLDETKLNKEDKKFLEMVKKGEEI